MKNNFRIVITLISLTLFGPIFGANDLHLNEGLPIMVDTTTELSDIYLTTNNITFTYQIKGMNHAEVENAKDDHIDFIEKKACNDTDIQELLKNDMNLNFIYKIDAQEVLKVKIDKGLCEEINQKDRVL